MSVADVAPPGLTATAMSGSGWTCAPRPCARAPDALPAGQSYPPIAIVARIAFNAVSPLANVVTVSTAATESSVANNSANDSANFGVGYVLGVMKVGTGSGVVTSTDGAIDCGPVCGNYFEPNAIVLLTATPAAGSVFIGWTDRCSGTGTCTVVMDGLSIVTATFAPSTPGTRTHILDIDGNSRYEASTDGLMIMRYLSGLSGSETVVNGALGTSPTRSDTTVINAYLDDIRPLLDVDGDGSADALSDGLIFDLLIIGGGSRGRRSPGTQSAGAAGRGGGAQGLCLRDLFA